MTEIAIVTRVPKLVTPDHCRKIQIAFTKHVELFCRMRDELGTPAVTFYEDEKKAPFSAWVLAFIDGTGGDTLAYHTEEDGRPDGVVFAGYLSANGGDVYGEIAESFGHEGLEILVNPHVNRVIYTPVRDPDGVMRRGIDLEVCDPMQGHPIVYDVDGSKVSMPGFTLPLWEDPQAPFGSDLAYPHGVIHKPLTLAGPEAYGSYVTDTGDEVSVFGRKVPQHIRELKRHHGRKARAKRLAAAMALEAEEAK
jgi:hypothetical protein